jgi:3-dehydroquinate synthase
LIALGGGTIGDAAGFAAATYYRGIPVVQIPTTLLAQVDSAIGGKTAVNHPLGKNAIGAFHQPSLVVADVDLLETLPKRDFLSGMAEVVKYGLVFSPSLMKRLDASWDRLLARDPRALEAIVAECVAWKVRVVAEDERDLSGRRELLNFGHTLGHALETATEYRAFRHGEAVAWGMLTACALSFGRGWMRTSGRRSMHLLSRLEPPRWPRTLRRAAVVAALASDKKVRGGKNVFVLLKEAGRPIRANDVTRAEIDAALDAIGS